MKTPITYLLYLPFFVAELNVKTGEGVVRLVALGFIAMPRVRTFTVGGVWFLGRDGSSWATALGFLFWIALVVMSPLVYGREYLASKTRGVPVSGPSAS